MEAQEGKRLVPRLRADKRQSDWAPPAGPASPTLLFSFSQECRVQGSHLLGSHCSEFSPHQVLVVASLSQGGVGMLKDLFKAMELSGISRREIQVS